MRSVRRQAASLHGTVAKIDASAQLLHLADELAMPLDVEAEIVEPAGDCCAGRRQEDESLVDGLDVSLEKFHRVAANAPGNRLANLLDA